MRSLTPGFYLVTNVVKSAIWIGLTVASLVVSKGYQTYYDSDGNAYNTGIGYSGFGIGMSIALM